MLPRPYVVFGLLLVLATLRVTASDQAFSLSSTYATYDGAVQSCQSQYGESAGLADYNTAAGKAAILSSCTTFGCWVAGGVLPYGSGQWCPYLYAPPGYTPPSDYQINSCSTFQRFLCAYESSGPASTASPIYPPAQTSPPYAASPPYSGNQPGYPAQYPGSPVSYPGKGPYPSPYPSPYSASNPSPKPPSPSPPPPSPPPPSPPPPSPPPPSPPSPPPPRSPPPSPPPRSPLSPPPRPPPSPPPRPPPTPVLAPVTFSPPPPSSSPDLSPAPPTAPAPDYPDSPPAGSQAPPIAPTNPEASESQYTLLSQLSMVVAVHLAHIPNSDTYLYMERPSGYHPDNSHVIAGTLDVATMVWTNKDSPDGLFCSGHTLMTNGSVSIVGGHVANAGYPAGIMSIRTYTLGQPSLVKVTTMRYPRWYPTATLLPTSQIMISGGTQGVGAGTANNAYYEIWDPTNPLTTQQFPVEPNYLKEVRQNYYPFTFVMPSGDLFQYCGRSGWLMDPYTPTYITPIPNRPLSVVSPKTVYTTQYPYTGTAVLLPLRPSTGYLVDVLIMGGQDIAANVNLSISACSESIRIQVSQPMNNDVWKQGGPYNFSAWQQEYMGSARVMGDSITLPNGKVILLNGAQQGLAGDSASGGDSRSNYPNFFAEMYDPDAPVNTRWTSLARSQIARLYHSTAAMTTNGTILVTGCDRCAKMVSNLNFSAPPHKAEYRNEIFYPPYWYATDKPAILTWPATTTYGATFTITYTGETDPTVVVDQVVLVAPGSVTHCFNTNQRTVELEIVSNSTTTTNNTRSITVKAPPNRNIAPPQYYMLFLLNGDSYSKAKWVHVTN